MSAQSQRLTSAWLRRISQWLRGVQRRPRADTVVARLTKYGCALEHDNNHQLVAVWSTAIPSMLTVWSARIVFYVTSINPTIGFGLFTPWAVFEVRVSHSTQALLWILTMAISWCLYQYDSWRIAIKLQCRSVHGIYDVYSYPCEQTNHIWCSSSRLMFALVLKPITRMSLLISCKSLQCRLTTSHYMSRCR